MDPEQFVLSKSSPSKFVSSVDNNQTGLYSCHHFHAEHWTRFNDSFSICQQQATRQIGVAESPKDVDVPFAQILPTEQHYMASELVRGERMICILSSKSDYDLNPAELWPFTPSFCDFHFQTAPVFLCDDVGEVSFRPKWFVTVDGMIVQTPLGECFVIFDLFQSKCPSSTESRDSNVFIETFGGKLSNTSLPERVSFLKERLQGFLNICVECIKYDPITLRLKKRGTVFFCLKHYIPVQLSKLALSPQRFLWPGHGLFFSPLRQNESFPPLLWKPLDQRTVHFFISSEADGVLNSWNSQLQRHHPFEFGGFEDVFSFRIPLRPSEYCVGKWIWNVEEYRWCFYCWSRERKRADSDAMIVESLQEVPLGCAGISSEIENLGDQQELMSAPELHTYVTGVKELVYSLCKSSKIRCKHKDLLIVGKFCFSDSALWKKMGFSQVVMVEQDVSKMIFEEIKSLMHSGFQKFQVTRQSNSEFKKEDLSSQSIPEKKLILLKDIDNSWQAAEYGGGARSRYPYTSNLCGCKFESRLAFSDQHAHWFKNLEVGAIAFTLFTDVDFGDESSNSFTNNFHTIETYHSLSDRHTDLVSETPVSRKSLTQQMNSLGFVLQAYCSFESFQSTLHCLKKWPNIQAFCNSYGIFTKFSKPCEVPLVKAVQLNKEDIIKNILAALPSFSKDGSLPVFVYAALWACNPEILCFVLKHVYGVAALELISRVLNVGLDSRIITNIRDFGIRTLFNDMLVRYLFCATIFGVTSVKYWLTHEEKQVLSNLEKSRKPAILIEAAIKALNVILDISRHDSLDWLKSIGNHRVAPIVLVASSAPDQVLNALFDFHPCLRRALHSHSSQAPLYDEIDESESDSSDYMYAYGDY